MDVAEVLIREGARSQGLLSTAALRAAGVDSWTLTRAARTGTLQRVRRGVYALAPLPTWPRHVVTDAGPAPDHVAHVRAVLLSLGSSATASGRTAAALRGWPLLVEPARTVEVALPHAHGHTAATRVRVVRRRQLQREAYVAVVGTGPLWVTSAEQTVVDLALTLPLLEAVVACDSALRAGVVTMSQLRRWVGRLQGRRDARCLVQVLDLADPLSGSVLESVLRVRLVQAGVAAFETQRTVLDAHGRRVLRTDFCFVAAGLVVETDGARWHEDHARDQRTDNALACAGWRVLRYGWSQVLHDAEEVISQIQAALAPSRTQEHRPDAAAA